MGNIVLDRTSYMEKMHPYLGLFYMGLESLSGALLSIKQKYLRTVKHA